MPYMTKTRIRITAGNAFLGGFWREELPHELQPQITEHAQGNLPLTDTTIKAVYEIVPAPGGCDASVVITAEETTIED